MTSKPCPNQGDDLHDIIARSLENVGLFNITVSVSSKILTFETVCLAHGIVSLGRSRRFFTKPGAEARIHVPVLEDVIPGASTMERSPSLPHEVSFSDLLGLTVAYARVTWSGDGKQR